MNKQLTAKIISVGAWGAQFHNWDDLSLFLSGKQPEVQPLKGPKPEVIPANERRRAPLPVRLAVESSWQAVQNSDYEPNDLASVFVSALGDTQLTDYMCKVLATPEKQLSPTKFHNSVHNAAAGYWTISTKCMHAANSIAGYEHSVPLTLLEAIVQVNYENRPMLLTFYDAPVSEILKPLLKNGDAFAVSIIISPASAEAAGDLITVDVDTTASSWPELGQKELSELYSENPTAKILALLEQLLKVQNKQESEPVVMPVSEASSIKITLG